MGRNLWGGVRGGNLIEEESEGGGVFRLLGVLIRRRSRLGTGASQKAKGRRENPYPHPVPSSVGGHDSQATNQA